MWLDLGCGGSPRGDVNLDLFFGDSPHTVQKIDHRKISNFSIGDATVLPYRDNVFKVVSAYHLVEHLPVPTNCIKEMARVSSKYVIIVVPNHPIMREHHEHLYSWSRSSMESLCKRYGKVVYSQIRLMWWNSDKALKAVNRLPFLALRRLAYHVLNQLMGMEIVTIFEVAQDET
jgi:hypothetical protein